MVQIDIVNGKPAAVTVTSLQVAEAFGKEHRNVMRDIQNLLESDDFTRLNFELSEYHDSTGRSLPMFILSRDGFLMVALAYNGPKTFAWIFVTSWNMTISLQAILLAVHIRIQVPASFPTEPPPDQHHNQTTRHTQLFNPLTILRRENHNPTQTRLIGHAVNAFAMVHATSEE